MQKGLRLLCLVMALFIVAAILPAAKSIAITEESDWFKGSPEISNQFDLGGDTLPFSISGNRDCVNQKVITRPEKVLPYWPYLQTEQSHESCVINTGYGAVSQSGYLLTAGETTFGRVIYPWGGSMTLMPVPRSANAIYVEPNPPNGVGLVLVNDFLANIEGTTLSTGEITYKVKNDTSVKRLVGSSGQRLGVQLDSVSFSTSGKWMVADIPFLGLSRINTNSFSVKTFDVSHNYNIGVAPGVQSAVTNNGRYVAVSSPSFTRFRLYDLENCSSSTSCKFLDLHKYFKDNISGFISGVRLRFSTDYSLRMYMVQQSGTARKIIRQTVRANGHPAINFGYLGMGDSFAAGEGAYQYKPITDTGQNKCHLSLRSYPYLIANELGINEAESVACSGAVIEDIHSSSPRYRGQVTDKISLEDRDNVKDILDSFWPGYVPQIEFLKEYEPEVATFSIVGNDVGFADKILRCLMPDTCFASYEDRVEVANEINNQFGRLTGLFSEIKEEMQGKKVYVIGYPEVVLDNGNCGGNVRLNAEEIKFTNQVARHLNALVKVAADKIGFFYVDVSKAFYGHRLCETNYPNEAMNGLTAGNDIINLPFTDFGGPIGKESFHPNDMGQRKFKETILEKTKNFTAAMPAPVPNAAPQKVTDNTELVKGAPKSSRQIRSTNYQQNMTPDTVLINEPFTISVDQSESGFKPLSGVEVWLHSEPIKLGEFTTNSHGDLDFEATISEDIPLGFHTVHVYGTSIAGKPIDLQKVIYVAAPPRIEVPEIIPEENNTEHVETPEVVLEEINENPVTEEDKQPVSNGDAKPPGNNPETEAGNEELMPQTEVIASAQSELTPSQASTQQPYAATPYQIPVAPGTNSNPAVAAASTTEPSRAPSGTTQAPEIPNSKTSWMHNPLIVLLFLPLGILTITLYHHTKK